MTTTATPALTVVVREPRAPVTAADVLVVGGSVAAPLNLLLVRSLTVYDVLLAAGFVLLVRERRLRLPPRGYLTAAFAFLLAATLSSFRATHATEALTQIGQYAFVFLVQIPAVLSVVRTRTAAITTMALVCAASVGAILYAFVTQETQGAGRVLVFYSENPNRLGYPAAYLAPLLMVVWQLSRRWRPRWRAATMILCLASGYLTVWAVAASASRSSAVGMLVAVVVFVVLRPPLSARRVVSRAAIVATVMLAAGSVGAVTGNLPTTLEDRVERSFAAGNQGSLVADREHLADAAVRAFVEFPYLGSGLDNFRYVTTNYDLEATPQLPHNLWLQLMVQVGAFGTIAFGLLLLLWFRDMRRAYGRAGGSDRSLLWGLVAAMCGVLAIFMFAPEMLDRHYWLLIALGLAVAAGAPDSRETERSTT